MGSGRRAPADVTSLNFIAGDFVRPSDGRVEPNVNPADLADRLDPVAFSSARDVERAVAAASRTLRAWDDRGPIARGELVRRAARTLEERADQLAATITREQGKLLREAEAEVERTIAVLEFAAGHGRRLNGVTTPADDDRTFAFTFRVPVGVTALITPWNFPLAIPAWKLGPALVSGCTVVLKPSPLTPQTATLLLEAFADAGVPPGTVNLVHGDREAGEALVADPRVRAVSFTGSVPVGREINGVAAPRLARTQLELGGKNAVLVLDDAVVEDAVDAVVRGAFSNAGQRCSATSRVVVQSGIRERFVEELLARVAELRVGQGTDPAADIGPVVDATRYQACTEAVEEARADGGQVVASGRFPSDLPDGYYVRPAIVLDPPAWSRIAQVEIFGPVVALLEAESLEDAIRIANGVEYGMSAAIFTQDLARIHDALRRLEAGMLHVNRPGTGAYPHLPHGGTKASQYGPPECSEETFDFYTELRSACVRC
jgi:acyl-CoA reductase-like NAD-dependent aldehyde dehydrogenase